MSDVPVGLDPDGLSGGGDGGEPLVEGDQGLGLHLEHSGITRVQGQRIIPPAERERGVNMRRTTCPNVVCLGVTIVV